MDSITDVSFLHYAKPSTPIVDVTYDVATDSIAAIVVMTDLSPNHATADLRAHIYGNPVANDNSNTTELTEFFSSIVTSVRTVICDHPVNTNLAALAFIKEGLLASVSGFDPVTLLVQFTNNNRPYKKFDGLYLGFEVTCKLVSYNSL